MSGCNACPRRCGVDRTTAVGACGVGAAFRVARMALHAWEEPCISGKSGSGAIFFSGCPLKCVFCQNMEISRGCKGVDLTEDQLIAGMQRLIDAGAQDIYLPDFKYTRPAKAAAYSAAPDYVERVGPALLEMRRQVQDRWDGDKMLSGMIVRHLILPGNTNSAIEALNWLHSHLPGTYVSLMAQYTPMPGLERYPELTRTITRREYDKVVDHALALGMDKVFLQERSAVGKDFIPAFDFTGIV